MVRWQNQQPQLSNVHKSLAWLQTITVKEPARRHGRGGREVFIHSAAVTPSRMLVPHELRLQNCERHTVGDGGPLSRTHRKKQFSMTMTTLAKADTK